jgi:hypothetical protein
VRRLERITFNNVSQDLVWKCRKKTWMTCYLFKQFVFFFIRSILGGLSQHNKHLLILDGHGSHVTLEAIK